MSARRLAICVAMAALTVGCANDKPAQDPTAVAGASEGSGSGGTGAGSANGMSGATSSGATPSGSTDSTTSAPGGSGATGWTGTGTGGATGQSGATDTSSAKDTSSASRGSRAAGMTGTGTSGTGGTSATGTAASTARPDTAPAGGTAGQAGRTEADNTKVNERDRGGATLTPFDQGGSAADREMTAKIRRAVVGDGALSFSAKNVKIITNNGKVVLRGAVKSEAERASIETKAKSIAGANAVENQLEVAK